MLEYCEDAPMGMGGTHCDHWWDADGACCWCGGNSYDEEEDEE